ncbi:hypothetical protein BU26DRAFT_522582 [Trematosphaeria pertusa]|uniref:Mid2 domain-containing protein n=1 Tax=Trematosphaeria pertusa TaxID=390896 RepID=A0A6A6I2Y6_9PLEO|nr:uncharacterized protein BU26DRAFT_522582 [Trematosphaeria pertusa]KAF2244844.1 hypothetical protein BU26DRAFT_522582 [Trematosphaeria pertusa]
MCVVTDPSTANSAYPIGTSMRGSCTNPEWDNAFCGDYCLSDQDLGGRLTACGDDKFCCADDTSCSCSNGAFQINPGSAQTIIGIEGLEHTDTSTIQVSTSSVGPTATTLVTAILTSSSSGEPSSTPTAAPVKEKATDKPGVKAGIALGVIFGVLFLGMAGWLIYKYLFSGNRWRKSDEGTVVTETSAPPRPLSTQDPYIPGNAASLMFDPPVAATTRRSQDNFDRGDAPIGNAYERNAQNLDPFENSSTTVGTRTWNAGQGPARGPSARPLSFVSDDLEEARYVRPRVNEMGV